MEGGGGGGGGAKGGGGAEGGGGGAEGGGGAKRGPRKEVVSHFRGPCKGFCKQYCACCVSADGRTLYGCVPIANSKAKWGAYRATINHPLSFIYTLPLCLHMCLCPQQGGDPCPIYLGDPDASDDRVFSGLLQVLTATCLCCVQEIDGTVTEVSL